MTFGVLLIAFSGFLLGGVWSVWRLEPGGKRTAPQLVMVAVLLGAALLALAAGILRLI